MELLLIVLAFLAIWALIFFRINMPIYKKHFKAKNGIVNHDTALHKFVFKVNWPSADIIARLSMKNVADAVSCTFDMEQSVVTVTDDNSSIKYYFDIQEYDGFSVFRLEQVSKPGMRSFIPFKINPFMVEKLQAEPLPFEQYGF